MIKSYGSRIEAIKWDGTQNCLNCILENVDPKNVEERYGGSLGVFYEGVYVILSLGDYLVNGYDSKLMPMYANLFEKLFKPL